MADYNNTASASNNATAAEELFHSEEDSGDIEQGIITSENNDGLRSSSSSWAAAAVTGGTSANFTSTATGVPGGLENVNEDAAPVPLVQQIAGMELNKKDDVASTDQGIITSENTDGSQSSSWAAAAVAGGTSADFTSTTTTWLPGGIENINEDAAPVPFVQQIAGMELNKKDVVASTEHASMP